MTKEFTAEPLELEWVDGRTWKLTAQLDWTSRGGAKVSVPAGFVTDFASIPRPLWGLLPPTGGYGKAAVLHDWMYQSGQWTPSGPPCERGDADGVLKEAMEDLGISRLVRWTIWSGVRSGGWVSWKRYRGTNEQSN